MIFRVQPLPHLVHRPGEGRSAQTPPYVQENRRPRPGLDFGSSVKLATAIFRTTIQLRRILSLLGVSLGTFVVGTLSWPSSPPPSSPGPVRRRRSHQHFPGCARFGRDVDNSATPRGGDLPRIRAKETSDVNLRAQVAPSGLVQIRRPFGVEAEAPFGRSRRMNRLLACCPRPPRTAIVDGECRIPNVPGLHCSKEVRAPSLETAK